jgi:predicted enzyme related to lactoylglutathione lyase
MKVTALALVVPDYQAGLDFYAQGLGFTVTANLDQGRKRWVTIRGPDGGPDIVLARADTDRQRAAIGDQCGGRVFLFLQTDNFARDAARITTAGGVFEELPRAESYGTVAVWRDPFGNRWDLIQPV